MEDRLVSLLRWFELRARVFQAGPLCRSSRLDDADGLGYIHVLYRGQLRIETANRPALELNQPSLLFYMTPTNHRLVPLGDDTETVCASFEFGAGLNNPLFQALPELIRLDLDHVPTLDATLRLLFTEAMEQHCGRQAVLDRLIEVVIVQLLRDLMDKGRLQVGLLAGLANHRLAKAINALHADPARAWSLERLADTAGMSRARFATVFHSTVGITPMAYLSEWRLGIAQSLLRKGHSVQLIADRIGYANASALSRAFAARVGLSPTAWLRKVESSGGKSTGDRKR